MSFGGRRAPFPNPARPPAPAGRSAQDALRRDGLGCSRLGQAARLRQAGDRQHSKAHRLAMGKAGKILRGFDRVAHGMPEIGQRPLARSRSSVSTTRRFPIAGTEKDFLDPIGILQKIQKRGVKQKAVFDHFAHAVPEHLRGEKVWSASGSIKRASADGTRPRGFSPRACPRPPCRPPSCPPAPRERWEPAQTAIRAKRSLPQTPPNRR